MPKGPKGQERPADLTDKAVHVMRIATGEIEKGTPPADDASGSTRPATATKA
jgi:hypothetical protein